VQPMGDELTNAPSMDATQKGKVNEQTSKCNRTNYVERPNNALNHSSKNTMNDNPTKGSEFFKW